MATSRSQKEVKNWPGILDSSCALRRFFYPTAQAARKPKSMSAPPPSAVPAPAAIPVAMPDTISASDIETPTEGSTEASLVTTVRSEKETKYRPPVSAAWKLASDPSNLTDVGRRKSRLLKELKPAKKTERKAWVWAARLERLERAARIEKSEWMEVPQEMEQPSASCQRLQRLQRLMRPLRCKTKCQNRSSAHRIQRAQKFKPSCPKKARKKVSKRDLKAQTPIHRRRHPWRFQYTKTNILVVDAKSKPFQEAQREVAGSSPSGRIRQRAGSQHMMGGQNRKGSGVPLCQRPTVLMGQAFPYTRQMQLRQEQLFRQPEYYDQYMIMLQQQQRKMQQQRQQEQMQHIQMAQRPGRHPFNYPASVLAGIQRIAPYAVPSKTPFQRMKRGKRLCGNFYYD